MTLQVRRIISLLFLILFLIITPAIILYGAGYKLKRNGFSIARTGMFIIESQPKGAKIFLNGKAQKTIINSLLNKNSFITAPAKIKNLLPGEYELALELEGYLSWQKKLSVNPGTSTFVKDIILFKKDLPVQIMPSNIESVNFSPDKNKAIIVSADRLTFLNLTDESKKSINQNYLSGKNIAWSSDGQKLVIDNYLFSLDDINSKIDLNKLTPGSFNYRWSNGILFYQDKTSIYRLDQKNLPVKIADNLEFKDYLVKTDYLYLIFQSKQAAGLKVIELASNKEIRDIGLPASADYSFINPDQTLLNLYDDSHKTLYLINPSASYHSPIIDIVNNLETTLWYDDGNLLYANNFEIWLYDLAAKRKILITRISDIISQAVMYSNKNYIIYSTAQTINAIELDERDKRNITELAKFDAINSLALNSRAGILYFSGRLGQTEGVYKYRLE